MSSTADVSVGVLLAAGVSVDPNGLSVEVAAALAELAAGSTPVVGSVVGLTGGAAEDAGDGGDFGATGSAVLVVGSSTTGVAGVPASELAVGTGAGLSIPAGGDAGSSTAVDPPNGELVLVVVSFVSNLITPDHSFLYELARKKVIRLS